MTDFRYPRVAALAAAVLAGLAASASAQQALELRLPGAKAGLEALRAMPDSRQVVVKFAEGTRVRMRAGGLAGMSGAETAAFAATLRTAGIPQGAVRRLHARPEAEIDAERISAERESGRDLADLNLYYVIDLPRGLSAATVADRLNALPNVEFAEPGPVPAPPPRVDIPPVTPDLTGFQGYKQRPPTGIGALRHGRYAGGDGRGFSFVDVEYQWQLDHEDLELPSTRMLTGGATPSPPAFSDTNHGTAVLGEIVGRNNGYGVTGITPSAIAFVAPARTSEFGYDPARAIGLASAHLNKGDVIVIEQQYWVCGFPQNENRYGPLEVLQSVFDAVSLATAKGISVVAAAGNGDVDLDGAGCGGLFDRAVRDSHSIIVGAGSSIDHSRLGFSSYGSRVDVQGWGGNVTTTGYGGAFNPGDIRQRYTHTFSGTSSATPIVAGAVLAINGVMKACGVNRLSPVNLRTKLVNTGTPQANPGTGHIGPLPRILAALKATKARSCVQAQAGTQVAAEE